MDYKEDLRKRLPELKKIEGFPIGEDNDIINLSSPPYYTACPNPYIEDFIEKNGTSYNEDFDKYYREPYDGDVSEGKRHPVYMLHSYHTKVPHKAIMNYISHFTNKGDIVLDCYSGSGMTGIAAQNLERNVILSDLSPAATFISFNNNNNIYSEKNTSDLRNAILKVEEEYKHLFKLPNKEVINYVIWSQIFLCPYCSSDINFWEYFVDKETEQVAPHTSCKQCNALEINKRSLKKKLDTNKKPIYIPVAVSLVENKKKYKRSLSIDESNYLLELQKNINIPYFIPLDKLPDGDNLSQSKKSHSFDVISDFYFPTSLAILSSFWDYSNHSDNENYTKFFCTSFLAMRCSKRLPYRPKGLSAGAINNLSIPSLIQQYNPILVAKRKYSKSFSKVFKSDINKFNSITSTQSSTDLKNIPNNSIDYIFTDPPFGSNIMYSDLNFLWESWLKVYTETQSETIINKTQNKNIFEYHNLLSNTFNEYFRVLKPKRWITVEFNNSKSSIWNSIRNSLLSSGFIIAQVSMLDKKLGSFKQVSSEMSVDKDLIIFAFKPKEKFITAINENKGNGFETEFVNNLLQGTRIENLYDRSNRNLYSKYVGFYLQNHFEINLDASSFYSLLQNNFIEEDGYWFTSNQINSYFEYKKKVKLEGISELNPDSLMLFISDEKTAILWLLEYLKKPKTFSDINTVFNQLASIQGDQVPELSTLLEDNFIKENNVFRRPKSELEHISINTKREKVLMREFESLLLKAKSEKKKIKEVRKEALVYGFEVCYKEKRFRDILTLSHRLDKKIIENTSELNDFVEAAIIMVEGIS